MTTTELRKTDICLALTLTVVSKSECECIHRKNDVPPTIFLETAQFSKSITNGRAIAVVCLCRAWPLQRVYICSNNFIALFVSLLFLCRIFIVYE